MSKRSRVVCRVRIMADADIPPIARLRTEAQHFDHRVAGIPFVLGNIPPEEGLRLYLQQGFPAHSKLPSFVLELDGQLAGFAIVTPHDGIGVDARGYMYYEPPFAEGAVYYGVDLAPWARQPGVERQFQRAVAAGLRDEQDVVAVDYINQVRQLYEHLGVPYCQHEDPK